MPQWLPRTQSQRPSGPESNAGRGQLDINRPFPPLARTAVDQDVPTLYPRRRAEQEATSTRHTRSFSHPFPSFFGGVLNSRKSEKRNLKNKGSVELTDDDELTADGHSNQSSNTPSRNPSVNAAGELMTGRCMTCDSTVRWPRDLKVFRCTICLTVNDLEPNHAAGEKIKARTKKRPIQASPCQGNVCTGLRVLLMLTRGLTRGSSSPISRTNTSDDRALPARLLELTPRRSKDRSAGAARSLKETQS